MLALCNGNTGRRLVVAGQDGEDIVRTTVPSLGDEAKVRWQGTIVSLAGLLLILVRPRDVVRQLMATKESARPRER